MRPRMFRRSRSSSIISVDVDEVERRLRTLERRLERLGGRTSARAAQAADQVGESIASALTTLDLVDIDGDDAGRSGSTKHAWPHPKRRRASARLKSCGKLPSADAGPPINSGL